MSYVISHVKTTYGVEKNGPALGNTITLDLDLVGARWYWHSGITTSAKNIQLIRAFLGRARLSSSFG
jgi:hypothetical protein